MRGSVNIVRTRGAIAHLLGVSVMTVDRWARLHGAPITREGGTGQLIARRDALLAWHARFCGNPRLHDEAATG